jgi:hypothetical protein
MKRWKLLGLAGLAGVAATGVVVARAERRRRAYTADDVRARLHERLTAADLPAGIGTAAPAPSGDGGPARGRLSRLTRRLRRRHS